ncbi:MAG: hypothetical protein ABIE22_00500 [archaeon]
MKKAILFFIGILLVSSFGFVVAGTTCTDSDGSSIITDLTTNNTIYTYGKSCVREVEDVGKVIGNTCSGEECFARTYQCNSSSTAIYEDTECGLGCEEGVCIQGNQTANDDDEDSGKGKGNTVTTQNKTRIMEKYEFKPWQKRNESECPGGCACHGAVVSCKTENGKTMTIEAGRSGNMIVITTEKVEVETELELESELGEGNQTRLKAKTKNGETKEVKLMGDEARERIRERARICEGDGNCTAKLSEINGQLMYEFEGKKESRLFALFKKQMKVKAEVDAETGEITRVNKPWWAFLASEE